jgi:hypothetical protein
MNGEKLKSTLLQLGISHTQFATLIEKSEKTISLWTNNHSPVPRSVSLYLELRMKNLAIAAQLTGST